MPYKYLNHIDLKDQAVGDERRLEMLNDIMENGTFLPKTVEYRDIDEAFKDWVNSIRITSDEGVEYPTFSLFSNQRFSEYSQSWEYTDENQNLLLNFKTITRENNPQYGKIQNGLWNIPGERFYLMARKRVLDDNGTESLLELRMRQPVAVDLKYKIAVFTTKYESINEFNTKINRLFASRQCYVCPNGHFMPMVLDGISDESQYNIDDRQFYSQSYTIRLMGYIITEDDYRVNERPMKLTGTIGVLPPRRSRPKVEIEEMEYVPLGRGGDVSNIMMNGMVVNYDEMENATDYFYRPIKLTVMFSSKNDKSKFTLDTDFVVNRVEVEGEVKGYTMTVNGDDFVAEAPFMLRNGDEVKITKNNHAGMTSFLSITFYGYNPNVSVSGELEDDEENYTYFAGN